MSTRSKVTRLPWELRKELERLWREGRYTLDELLAKLREMAPATGTPEEELPSRSGLHAYLHSFETKLARYKEAQEIAGMWIARLGEDPHGDVGRLLAEVLKTIAIQTVDQLGENGKTPKANELMMLSIALKNIAQSDKLSTDRELRVRKDLAEKLDEAIAEETKRPPSEGGLSADAAERIRAALMGQ